MTDKRELVEFCTRCDRAVELTKKDNWDQTRWYCGRCGALIDIVDKDIDWYWDG